MKDVTPRALWKNCEDYADTGIRRFKS